MSHLTERTALVTGGSRGIGRAIAEAFAKHGASVAVNFRSSGDEAKEVVSAILDAGGTAIAVQGDVSNSDEAENVVKQVTEEFGKLDILVNNAGITRDGLIMRMSEDDWDAVLTTNLKGTFNCSKAVIKNMMRQRYGRIINISSVSGVAGNAGQTNYAASKAGIIGFTKSLAREVATRGITANVIAPGFIETEMSTSLDESIQQATLATIPMGRWGQPADVAELASFLASEEAGYITGQVINVDGGMVMS